MVMIGRRQKRAAGKRRAALLLGGFQEPGPLGGGPETAAWDPPVWTPGEGVPQGSTVFGSGIPHTASCSTTREPAGAIAWAPPGGTR